MYVFLICPECDGPGSLLYRSREIQLEMIDLIDAVVRIILLRTAAFFIINSERMILYDCRSD